MKQVQQCSRHVFVSPLDIGWNVAGMLKLTRVRPSCALYYDKSRDLKHSLHLKTLRIINEGKELTISNKLPSQTAGRKRQKTTTD
jgi:hypothetical protein